MCKSEVEIPLTLIMPFFSSIDRAVGEVLIDLMFALASKRACRASHQELFDLGSHDIDGWHGLDEKTLEY